MVGQWCDVGRWGSKNTAEDGQGGGGGSSMGARKAAGRGVGIMAGAQSAEVGGKKDLPEPRSESVAIGPMGLVDGCASAGGGQWHQRGWPIEA